MRKVVASGTLGRADWNTELVWDHLVEALRRLKDEPGRGILVGGVRLPTTLAAHGLIDEYTSVVHPVIAGRGPRLLDGVDLKLELIERREFRSGAIVQRFRPAEQN